MAVQRIQLERLRPFFAELPYYLWGRVNYDSEGDCKKPTDCEWTWIYLQNRDSRETVEVKHEEGNWIIVGDNSTAARLAMFLIDRSGAIGDSSVSRLAGVWNHQAALARTLPVRREFEQAVLRPFDSHVFWGSWKWIGWFATEFTWVGRWIMHSLVRNDPRAISLCIDWIKETRFAEQSAALSCALERLSGEPPRAPSEWVRWYEGSLFEKGAKSRFPAPNMDAWLAELKEQCDEES